MLETTVRRCTVITSVIQVARLGLTIFWVQGPSFRRGNRHDTRTGFLQFGFLSQRAPPHCSGLSCYNNTRRERRGSGFAEPLTPLQK
jgi:hypothetical protein